LINAVVKPEVLNFVLHQVEVNFFFIHSTFYRACIESSDRM
jgi:hypothetical protein